MNKRVALILLLLLPAFCAYTQVATVVGVVCDGDLQPIQFANVSVVGTTIGTVTDEHGRFALQVPADTSLNVEISFVGCDVHRLALTLPSGESHDLGRIVMQATVNILPETNVEAVADRHISMTRLDPQISMKIPTIGGFEDILKSLPSVSSSNELSSQYNVRGGNFDENLVFVNDVEIYRPMLLHSGQQEGLSFINSDMVSAITFSAGGFESKYGDKMSSVLDIKYRKPTSFGGTVSASMLGANVHVEGTSKNYLFRYNTGLRYKTTRYVLGSLDLKGDYDPQFLDYQLYMTYDVSDKLELSFLGNISSNNYTYVPTTRETSWGTLNEAIKIKMYFDGQEKDVYANSTAAFIANYAVNKNLNLRFIASGYYADERETFDILGQYYLNELDKDLGSDNLGDSVVNIGIGSFLNHARNYLTGYVVSAKHIGEYKINNHKILWGLQYNNETFDYVVSEWDMNDSAGYSLPYIFSSVVPPNRTSISMYSTDFSDIDVNTNRLNAFVQDSYMFEFDNNAALSLGGGIRLNFWDFNREFVAAPRLNIGFKPAWKANIIFRLSSGLYHQVPFFKEVRQRDGTLNKNIKSQSSYQVVLGSDYVFKLWRRPFKLVTEAYYKYLYNLIPYSVDNMQLIYYGRNMASGYAVGVEAKINGEFVKGTESWFSIAVMQTMEDIDGDFSVQHNDNGTVDTTFYGFIPRPSDQRLNLGIYFQDYIPHFPTWQVYLSLIFNTGLPFGPPNSERYTATSYMKPYRRVDLGISKQLLGQRKRFSTKNPLHYLKSVWLSLEAFNLLDVNNEVSHTWVTDIKGRQYAVPNYLTGRRINLKLIVKF